MADYSEEELELIREHRAKKARQAGRKVRVRGRHDDSGAEYEFDLEGDEAERVISRHRGLFAEEDEDDGDGADDAETHPRRSRKTSGDHASGGEAGAGQGRKAPSYFKR